MSQVQHDTECMFSFNQPLNILVTLKQENNLLFFLVYFLKSSTRVIFFNMQCRKNLSLTLIGKVILINNSTNLKQEKAASTHN